VRLDSTPRGADVLLGSRPLGKTPLDHSMRDGQTVIKVRVRLDGYIEEEATLDAARVGPLVLTLTPLRKAAVPRPSPSEMANERPTAEIKEDRTVPTL
jgi:hypothetical protein